MGIDDVRKIALALPGTEEAKHFNLPSFKVDGKGFITLIRGNTHAIVSVDRARAEAAAAENPGVYEVVWRNNGRIYVGLGFSLAKVRGKRLEQWVEAGWRHKAPRQRLAAFETTNRSGGEKPEPQRAKTTRRRRQKAGASRR